MPKNQNGHPLEERVAQLQQQNNRLKTTLDHIGAYVFMKDLQGRYTYVNQLVCELFGHAREAIIGKDDTHFFSLEESNDLRVNDQKVMNEGTVISADECNIIASTGEIRYYQTVKSPLLDEQGNICGMFGVATDITERKHLEQELIQKQELLDCILNNIDAYIYLKDQDNRFLYANPKTEELLQQPLTSMIGKSGEEFLPPNIAKTFVTSDQEVCDNGEKISYETKYTLPDGSKRHFWSIKIPMKNESGEVDKIINLSTDVTELANLRHQLQEKLKIESLMRKEKEKIAITDPLTGLYNRLKINESIQHEIARARRYRHKLCIILIDIDFFKQVNDQYGHLIGDDILVAFASIIRKHTRKADRVGRWGGEEFIVICPETSINGAITLAKHLQSCIERFEFPKANNQTASFGITEFRPNDSIESLVGRADNALYQAKHRGRNRVEVN
jgi:diguanylate cyclase (GGDEF)-like protein/PAS domain S-box-containing protein